MPFDFNPITGQLDLVDSGAGYINGVVADPTALPVTVGTPALDSVFLAKAGSGVWLINRRPAGLYVRVANNGNAADWTYLGAFPEVNADGNWELYNSTDPTKELKFDLSGISTGTTRTITVPDSSGTIELLPSITSVSLTTGAATHTASSGRNQLIRVSDTTMSGGSVILPSVGNIEGDQFVVRLESTLTGGVTIRTSNYSLITGLGQVGRTRSFVYTSGAWLERGVEAHTHVASDISGTFNTLSANGGTVTASAPVLDLSQTWVNASVTFTGMRFNVTNTASASASLLADFQVGGASLFSVDRSGSLLMTSTAGIRQSTATNPVLLGGIASFNSAGLSVYGASVRTNRDSHFGWTPDTNHLTAADLQLHRDAADTLAQRRTTNPQAFRLYNTFTDASNYERGFMRWSSNVLQIGAEAAGTGSARALEFQTGGTTRLTIAADGNTVFGNNVTITSGRVLAANQINLNASSTALLALGTDSTIRWGSSSTTTPALKRSSTTLQVRLADDSAYTVLDAQLRAQGTAPATSGATGTAGDIRYDADYIYVCTAANTWKRVAIATW